MKNFVASLVDHFTIGPNNVQIAVVRYCGVTSSRYVYYTKSGQYGRHTSTIGTSADGSSGITIVFHLDKHYSKDDIKNKITSMPYCGGKTATGE